MICQDRLKTADATTNANETNFRTRDYVSETSYDAFLINHSNRPIVIGNSGSLFWVHSNR